MKRASNQRSGRPKIHFGIKTKRCKTIYLYAKIFTLDILKEADILDTKQYDIFMARERRIAFS